MINKARARNELAKALHVDSVFGCSCGDPSDHEPGPIFIETSNRLIAALTAAGYVIVPSGQVCLSQEDANSISTVLFVVAAASPSDRATNLRALVSRVDQAIADSKVDQS